MEHGAGRNILLGFRRILAQRRYRQRGEWLLESDLSDSSRDRLETGWERALRTGRRARPPLPDLLAESFSLLAITENDAQGSVSER